MRKRFFYCIQSIHASFITWGLTKLLRENLSTFVSHLILFHSILYYSLVNGNACSNSNNNNLLLQQSSVLVGNILTWISTLWFRIDVNQRLRCLCTTYHLASVGCAVCTVHCTLCSTLKWFDAMRCDLRVPTTKSKSCPSTEIPIKLQ